MYVGETFEAIPIATPPMIRQLTKVEKWPAQPVRTELTANKTAARISSFFLPKRSLMAPETTEPTRHPIRAQLFAHPISSSELS